MNHSTYHTNFNRQQLMTLQAAENAPTYSTSDSTVVVWSKLVKKWWYVVLIAVVASVLLAQIPYKPRFESKASLLFTSGEEYVYREDIGDRAVVEGTRSELRSAIHSESVILTSQDVLLETLQRVGVENYRGETQESDGQSFWGAVRLFAASVKKMILPSDSESDEFKLQETIEKFESNLNVRFIDNSAVLEVGHIHHNPEFASLVLTQLLEVFLERRREIYSSSALQPLKVKLAEVEEELALAESDFNEFNRVNQVYSIDDERSALLSQKLEAESELDLTTLEHSSLVAKFESLGQQLLEIPETSSVYSEVQSNPIHASARQRLVELLQKQSLLLKRYLPKHSKIVDVRAEIKLLSETLDTENEYTTQTIRKGRNAQYDRVLASYWDTQGELLQLESKKQSLGRQIELKGSRLRKLESLIGAQREKKQRYELLDRTYKTYLQEVEKSELIESLAAKRGGSAKLVQAPSMSFKPMGMSGFDRSLFAGFLGLIGAIAALVFIEIARRPILGTPIRSPLAIRNAGTEANGSLVVSGNGREDIARDRMYDPRVRPAVRLGHNRAVEMFRSYHKRA